MLPNVRSGIGGAEHEPSDRQKTIEAMVLTEDPPGQEVHEHTALDQM